MRTFIALVLVLWGSVADAQLKEEQARAEATCKKQLPRCSSRRSAYVVHNPCGTRGAACPPELPKPVGEWSCTCLDCKTSAQCEPGWQCQATKGKKRCVPTAPPEEPAAPGGPVPLPPSSPPAPEP